MKTILSRKGFDTSYGKGYSPILPDGKILSMPIPVSGGEKGISLGDLMFNGKSYRHYARQLYPKLSDSDLYHFDPDLNHGSMAARHPKWKGAFGQAHAAHTHLCNEGVSEGDLFLFFGSFKQTCFDNGILKWESQHPFHAIFGYLEVGKIIRHDDIKAKLKDEIYANHPHYVNAKLYDKQNALYVAADNLSGTELPGSGTLKYNDRLRLTKPGYTKSVWELPGFFGDEKVSISRHGNRSRFRRLNDKLLLSTVGIGQDFVIDDPSGRVVEWSRGIIERAR